MTRRLDILPLLSALLLCLAVRPAMCSTNAPDVVFTQTDSTVSVTTADTIVSVYMRFDGPIAATLVPIQMIMGVEVVADTTYVIIYSLSGESFTEGEVITYTGSGRLDSVQAVNIHEEQLTTAINIATGIGGLEDPNLPDRISLSQNFPNPFNPSTEIQFSLPSAALTRLTIHDLLGREVLTLLDQSLPAGQYGVVWDGHSRNGETVASGVYIYRLTAGTTSLSRKMLLLR